jgi:hydrogenase maturation protein HypF
LILDPLPLVRHVAERLRAGGRVEDLARLFHVDLAAALAEATELAAARTHLETVVLSGGVMVNELFVCELRQRLEHAELRVLEHRVVPPNDGGLALGQLAVAAARFERS